MLTIIFALTTILFFSLWRKEYKNRKNNEWSDFTRQ
jgi:hypothetical protein